ncbi:MAG: tripartite tricarboxylate transporter substrate binding protein [Burkholderiales bacterium]|nr:tripartite tricarboxylate transporter substrate binding protein [Burkholderiales bacterium]
MFRKTLVAASVVLLAAAGAASAADYPARPVRFIVPFAPGGNTDVQGRLIAMKLSERWKQQVVVDNRAGAGGTLGVEILAKAPADGYTLALASFGNILVGPSLFPKLPYDPLKDLAPVVLVSQPPGLLVVNPGLPVKNVAELIAYGKANPGKLNYGSAGNGTWNHLFAEHFKALTGVQMTHIPYKGANLAVTDVMSGQIQLSFAPFPAALPQIKSNRLRVLGVTSVQRSPVLPDVPTVAESGLPGYSAATWFAMLAPANTPKPLIDRINRDANAVLALPEVKAAFAADGTEPAGGTPEQLRESMRSGIAQWGKLVRELGIRL